MITRPTGPGRPMTPSCPDGKLPRTLSSRSRTGPWISRSENCSCPSLEGSAGLTRFRTADLPRNTQASRKTLYPCAPLEGSLRSYTFAAPWFNSAGNCCGEYSPGIPQDRRRVQCGSDPNWTGLAPCPTNLYGFARLCWNPGLSAAEGARKEMGAAVHSAMTRELSLLSWRCSLSPVRSRKLHSALGDRLDGEPWAPLRAQRGRV